MTRTKIYKRYEITNSHYKTINRVATLEAAREIIKKHDSQEDKPSFTYDFYHIYMVNEYSGYRLKEVY